MGNLIQLYQQVQTAVKGLTDWARVEHSRVLAWMMIAILHSHDVCLERLGMNLPSKAKPESIGQQFRRWLKNPRVDDRAIYDPVARHVLKSVAGKCGVRLQIDRVLLKKRFNVLMVSVRWQRRAIPLVWLVLASKRGMSTLKQQQTVLQQVAALLPSDTSVMVLGDREFGVPKLMRWIQQQGWYFYLRVKGNLEISFQQGNEQVQWQRLDTLPLLPKIPCFLQRVVFTKVELLRVNFALCRAEGSDDPWYIATNAPACQGTLKEYGRRFGCEELFSDLKKRGFNWEDSLLRHPQRLARLLLVLALATVWLIGLGRQVCLRRWVKEITSTSHRCRYSLFQLGRRWLKHRIASLEPLPPDLLTPLLSFT